MSSIPIDKISLISRINLDELEKGIVSEKLEQVVEYVEMLNKFHDKSINQSECNSKQNVFRADDIKIASNYEKEIIIKNAPLSMENLFVVPLLVKRIG